MDLRTLYQLKLYGDVSDEHTLESQCMKRNGKTKEEKNLLKRGQT